MKDQIFSDGIGSIAVIGGVVRIDLVTFATAEKDAGGQPKVLPSHQLVMSLEAFLRSTEKMQGAVQAFAKLAAQRQGEASPAQPAPESKIAPVQGENSKKSSFP